MMEPKTQEKRKAPVPSVELPQVRLMAITPQAERVVCLAARGDYFDGFVADETFESVMAPIEGATLDEKVRNLIALLMKRGHFGPFEHVSATFGIKGMSRACMAQITRHRIASFDIQSQRYVNFGDQTPEDMCWPPSFTEDEVKAREHGRHVITMSVEERRRRVEALYAESLRLYNDLVAAGVPKEDARMVLPEASRVNGTMTINALSLIHI